MMVLLRQGSATLGLQKRPGRATAALWTVRVIMAIMRGPFRIDGLREEGFCQQIMYSNKRRIMRK
jgi:hypothetical protein